MRVLDCLSKVERSRGWLLQYRLMEYCNTCKKPQWMRHAMRKQHCCKETKQNMAAQPAAHGGLQSLAVPVRDGSGFHITLPIVG